MAITFGAQDNYQVRGQPSRTFLIIISVITTTHEPTVYSTEHKDEGDTAHPNGRRDDDYKRRGGRGGEDRRRNPRVLVLRSQLSSTAAAHSHMAAWAGPLPPTSLTLPGDGVARCVLNSQPGAVTHSVALSLLKAQVGSHLNHQHLSNAHGESRAVVPVSA